MDGLKRELGEVVAALEKAGIGELCSLGAHVDRMDGDTLADCYYNSADESDGADVAAALALAANFLRNNHATLSAALVDAERYRWLRDDAQNADRVPFIAQRDWHGIVQWAGEQADATIDAARKSGAGREG